jgi:hypothetical protein
MNPEKQRLIFAFGVITALTMTLTVSVLAAQDIQSGQSSRASNAHPRTIAGAWRTVVTPRNCQTCDPFGSFPGTFTFHQGGTMSEYGIGPGSSPALRSPGHGIWQRRRDWRDYSFTFLFYRYDEQGLFIGSQKITAVLSLGASGDRFTTRSVIEILDANDNVVATGCATAAGTRFD